MNIYVKKNDFLVYKIFFLKTNQFFAFYVEYIIESIKHFKFTLQVMCLCN